jgi:ParB-like chromosome segregation protein Spo0J
MNECGIISGYVVHPAADVFPLLQGDDFDHLVESIVKNGVQHPIVVWRGHDGDVLIDGRNRLRAAEEARRLGHDVAIPVTEWKDDGRNVAEWIWDTNARRRQMTEDGIALASAAIAPLIAKENEARQAATKFDSEKASKAAKARHAVDTKTDPPQKRDAKQKNARSTVGQVAAKAGTSIHKARQAVAVQKAIEAGALPAGSHGREEEAPGCGTEAKEGQQASHARLCFDRRRDSRTGPSRMVATARQVHARR